MFVVTRNHFTAEEFISVVYIHITKTGYVNKKELIFEITKSILK
jgi:hypothetical protein